MAGYAPAALRVMGWGSEMRPYPVKMKGVRVMHEMTNIFTKEKTDNAQTITTLEIAEMMNIGHWQVLRKLDGREESGKHIKGYVEILTDNQMVASDYFSESVYKDASGKENRCYNVTKLGCDFLANKFTGEKGVLFTAKYVKRFDEMENRIKEESTQSKIEQSAFLLKYVADDMRINDASRLLMYENLCKDFNIPTGFLPKYEHNGNRQMKSLSTLLKENGCGLSAVKLNPILIEQGYLEEKERPSSKKDEMRKYKSLTEKGMKYGENVVSPHNQRETQPLYYVDTFMELYHKVAG